MMEVRRELKKETELTLLFSAIRRNLIIIQQIEEICTEHIPPNFSAKKKRIYGTASGL